MRFTSRSFPAVAVLIILGAFFLPGRALAFEPFKCSSCHRQMITGPVAHKPVAAGQCLRCHRQVSGEHPLEKGSMDFVVPKLQLCAHCHGKLVQKKFLHKPVGDGTCTLCHEAHSAQNKSLLKDPTPVLCFRCHPKDKFQGKHMHPPVAKGDCLSCHDAHQSDGRMLLKKAGKDFCFMCHDAKLGHGKSVHKPVADRECLKCHQPHRSEYRKLLNADMPTELYRPFGSDAFPLCFTCHNSELVAAVRTDKATNFRNGDRNLHAVHVNKAGKGRNCLLCHDPHSSSQDRLIYTKSPKFGSWEIPIRFNVTPTGGGCSVGCHKTFRYDRVTPVVN